MIVGMPNSVHLARWTQVARSDSFRIIVLPVYAAPFSKLAEPFIPIDKPAQLDDLPEGTIGVISPSAPDDFTHGDESLGPTHADRNPGLISPRFIAGVISSFSPRILHTLETQLAGYCCLSAKPLCPEFPIWLHSNWGSDIYLFRKLQAHRPLIIELLKNIDAYLAECGRDVAIARQMGFSGPAFPPMPASGGTDVGSLARLAHSTPPSQRREIMVKGYHGWSGRGLHVLSALYMAAPRLRSYKIRVRLASPEVQTMAATVRDHSGLDIEIDTYFESHQEALAHLAKARVAVGFGISDGISTTLLEAMSVGAYPIQTSSSCACEWIRHGRDGTIVGPHDIKGLADAIVHAATDDELVDRAAERNLATVRQRWDLKRNTEVVRQMYRALIEDVRAEGFSPRRLCHD